MSRRAAVTVNRSREDVMRLWRDPRCRIDRLAGADAAVTFRDAPGDRGTEIHVDLAHDLPAGRLGEILQKLVSGAPLTTVKEDLRRFKQLVETGEIARSDATPEGESARLLAQRPAQPLAEQELAKVGAP